jgi:hypothetical protein
MRQSLNGQIYQPATPPIKQATVTDTDYFGILKIHKENSSVYCSDARNTIPLSFIIKILWNLTKDSRWSKWVLKPMGIVKEISVTPKAPECHRLITILTRPKGNTTRHNTQKRTHTHRKWHVKRRICTSFYNWVHFKMKSGEKMGKYYIAPSWPFLES